MAIPVVAAGTISQEILVVAATTSQEILVVATSAEIFSMFQTTLPPLLNKLPVE
eukprot:CAMPEP_0195517384 /NCGR_PEP_ID=MMETSP0794_2-20130614/10641_1 /TAXON_ID=515487 /ORGANISM="Stephanopyxis turris, Strain CCMP 815" /LENGTH=53 /DNA_ID=CAMNT_0040646181 /DNA_START=614 /DNA_END=775 /DNA_ORIENTATION=+